MFSIPPLAIVASTIALAVTMSFALFPKATIQWYQRKKYLYEVTLPLYICTPAEKVVINSILILFFGLVMTGSVLYLPGHLAIIASRAVYYYSGSMVDVAATAARENGRGLLKSLAGFGGNSTSILTRTWGASSSVVVAAEAATVAVVQAASA